MYKKILSGQEDLGTFAIVAMLIFTIFFVGVVVRIITYRKKFVEEMSSLPLDDASKLSENLKKQHI